MKLNRRKKLVIQTICLMLFLGIIIFAGHILRDEAVQSVLLRKNMPPSRKYLFGTDWLGRDMFARTVCGISNSIVIGIIASAFSALAALILGVSAAVMGKFVDNVITWFIDLVMSVPHMLLLIIICMMFERGIKGVIIAMTFTHWTNLARVIRNEVIVLKSKPYIKIAQKMGKSKMYIAIKHMLPHIFPQFMVGLVLLFPHVILHEASVTFLGFGLGSEQPAIGIILSEAMRYIITGKWWLALFPGLSLIVIVLSFYVIGENVRKLLDVFAAYE